MRTFSEDQRRAQARIITIFNNAMIELEAAFALTAHPSVADAINDVRRAQERYRDWTRNEGE